ncbi:Lariat debranching enzyme C-terminal [Trinorchestia longiramus]|nr:Lariat debranching enzyme C-terminal [Trinorchestia longiramus]
MFAKVRTSHLQHKEDSMLATVKGMVRTSRMCVGEDSGMRYLVGLDEKYNMNLVNTMKHFRVHTRSCSHGELDVIYAAVEHAQEMSGISIDLLICCGDFQAVRNPGDLRCMAAPLKYLHMQSFYKYYSGEKKAPMLTLFIGGNHEASNHLQELPYGGWVAPNIYYLGYGGVVHVGGLRIGGVSGIYKGVDYLKGRYERPPYTEISIRSVYHARNLEVFRMKQLDQSAGPLDIFLTHDWPRGITKFGDAEKLCRVKPFFTEEVEADALGSKSAQELLQHLQPRYWFSGHLHVKFVALVDHSQNSEDKQPGENSSSREIPRFTRFIALDKCLPRREFLQVLSIKCGQMHKYQNVKLESSSKPCNLEDVPKTNNSDQTGDENLPKVNSLPASNLYSYSAHDESGNLELHHDLEWLTVLRLTDHLLKVTPYAVYMPGPGSSERYDFTPTQDDLLETLRLMGDDLRIHTAQFRRTAQAFHPERDALLIEHLDTVPQPEPVLHPHTQELCERLRIRDPMAELLKGAPGRSPFVAGTPRGAALLSEVDVTLDASRLTYADEVLVARETRQVHTPVVGVHTPVVGVHTPVVGVHTPVVGGPHTSGRGPHTSGGGPHTSDGGGDGVLKMVVVMVMMVLQGNASDGDIVFEVSISDNTDGTSEGVLSPAITPTR